MEEFADVIDTQMPTFVMDEDKSLQTKMIIKKKAALGTSQSTGGPSMEGSQSQNQ